MRRNPYTAQAFHTNAPPALQIAADMALEGLARNPANEGFFWVKPLTRGDTTAVDLLAGSGTVLAKAGGDLTKLDLTLIPEGGVVCPAGSFIMGSPESESGRRQHETQHRVTLTRPFGLGKYPVTRALYASVMKDHHTQGEVNTAGARRPAVNVTRYDVIRFCARLSELLGLDSPYTIEGQEQTPGVTADVTRNGFRLPTEAEWEYAARSGGDPFVYAGSNNPDAVGWSQENSGGRSHVVGQKKPNRWGLYDMSGNVWEWVEDVYAFYPGDTCDYLSADSGSFRVFRGGNWDRNFERMRVADRAYGTPTVQDDTLGFRICRTLPAVKPNPRKRK